MHNIPNQTVDVRDTVSVPEAARLLGTSPLTVRQMIESGELGWVRPARRVRVLRSSVEARLVPGSRG